MNQIINYLKNSKAELQHVTWPSRNKTIAYTAIIIAITILIAVYVAVLDYGFGDVIQSIINR